MTTEFNDKRIHYDKKGVGPTLVLLHGFLEDSQIWEPFLPELSKKHQVFSIDLLGHGKTQAMGEVHSMEKMAGAVHHVLAENNIREASFIGHSLGGYVALAFAEKYPDIINQIILLNSTPEVDSPDRKKSRDRAVRLLKTNKEAFIRMAVKNLFAPENLKRCQVGIEKLVSRAQQLSPEAIIASVKGMKNRHDRTKILADFPGAKTIITGEKDPIIPFEAIKKVAEESGSDLCVFPNGHMSFLEDKHELMEFFEGIF